jgi:hypothetical protein
MPFRRLEDHIQQLCIQLLATDDEEEVRHLCSKLKKAINQHVGRMRERLKSYPNDTFDKERRSKNKK